MGAFADKLRQGIQKNEGGSTGNLTDRILQQQAVSGTGKAVTGPTGQFNVAERAAAGAAQSQQEAVQAATQSQADQLAGAEQQAELQRQQREAQFKMQEKALDTQRSNEVDNLLTEININKTQGDTERYLFNLELADTYAALQDKQYIHNVQMVGERNRIDDRANFRKEAANLEIGHRTNQWLAEKGWRIEEGALARDFKEKNLIEDLDDAESYMQAKFSDQSKADMLGGATQLGGAGIQYAYRDKKKTPEGEV